MQNDATNARPAQYLPHSGALGRAERRIASMIFRNPEITQNEIVQRVDFTQQYVSKVVKGLVDRRIIRQVGTAIRGRGQPSPTLCIRPDTAYALGVAVMTDALKFDLVDLAGVVRSEANVAIAGLTIDSLQSSIEETLPKLVEEAAASLDRVVGIGIGMTGYFVGDRRKVNPPDALSKVGLLDVDETLSERLQWPVLLDNDGNTAAIAEAMTGVGRWASSFAYFYVSAGFGGGIVIDGQLYRGAHGNAGEFANIIRNDEYYPTLGTLRSLFSENGVAYDDIDSMLKSLDLESPVVQQWLDEGSEALSRFASSVTAVFDPEAIVFGGRLPKELAERLIEKVEIFNADRRGIPKPNPKLVPAESVGEATSLGAALLPLLKTYY